MLNPFSLAASRIFGRDLPGDREIPALAWFDCMDAASVLRGEEAAGSVRRIHEDQSEPVGREPCEFVDELLLRELQESGQPCDLRVIYPDDSGPSAAFSAAFAMEFFLYGFH